MEPRWSCDGAAMELALTLDLRSEADLPLHRQIYEQIRLAILAGKLRSH
jgi:hypothetical protein